MSEPLLERYQRSAIAARLALAGSPYPSLPSLPSEDYEVAISPLARRVIDHLYDRITQARDELDKAIIYDPVVAVQYEQARRIDRRREA